MEFPVLLQAVAQPFVFCLLTCLLPPLLSPWGGGNWIPRRAPSTPPWSQAAGGWKATIWVQPVARSRVKHIGSHAGPQKEQSSYKTWARAPETGCKSPASLAVITKEVQFIFPKLHYGSQDLGYRLGPFERMREKIPALGVMGAEGWFYKKSSVAKSWSSFHFVQILTKIYLRTITYSLFSF